MLMLSETKSKKQQLGVFVYLSCPCSLSAWTKQSITYEHLIRTVTEKIAMTSCCTQQILPRRRARPSSNTTRRRMGLIN